MRFLPDGPDAPDDLVAAQETGQTIFVCGAGVSRTIGLPLFRRLVKDVYRELGEDWNLHPAEREGMRRGGRLEGQYDRVLRCLERRLAGSDLARQQGMRERIRSAVRKALSLPEDTALADHLALLELSRSSEGQARLVTTNFDTAFERAWSRQHDVPVASHAGAAMPQPKTSGFAGVLHLHGRLVDPVLGLEETNLVLTSAEFGDAYLRLGWASRYVYDLVRTHTVVLVGYQADDPPMRYLLEALEADRERYPDLQQVYAFASCSAGESEVTAALWRAKGVKPILYETDDGDHSPLYQTLREWKQYADDPTAWRRERLRLILSGSPAAVGKERIDECASLLRHGDAPQLLGDLSPEAEWLPVLADRGVFDGGKAHPGAWIARRLNDPDMIKACAAFPVFDEPMRRFVDDGVRSARQTLPPVPLKAWRLMLAAKQSRPTVDLDFAWYIAAEEGETGYGMRQLVASILRPRLWIGKPWGEGPSDEGPEALHHLLRIEFRSEHSPRPDEILQAWPQVIHQEVALFRVLERAFIDALEEAGDVGFLEGADLTSWDVPSVARHPQNAHRSGFYPITRTLADVWQRIADRDHTQARALAIRWSDRPFLLAQRLYLYMASFSQILSAKEAASAVLTLSDDVFWLSGAQVEIMRLLVGRWRELSQEDRDAIETRLQEGIPSYLFPAGAFGSEERLGLIRNLAVLKRLKRLSSAEAKLSVASLQLLEEFSARHSQWKPGPDDRDDFHSWEESRLGFQGHPELLADVPDEALVNEAMRLQLERPLDEGEIWRLLCLADPNRTLRALRIEADAGNWNIEAWQSFFWEAGDTRDAEFQFELADLLAKVPDGPLSVLLSSATLWLKRHCETLTAKDWPGGPRFFSLWDRFADLAYSAGEKTEVGEDNGLFVQSTSEPVYVLADVLVDSLVAANSEVGSGFGLELAPRFDRVVGAQGRAGLLARICLAGRLAYLNTIDPLWAEEKLTPRLAWNDPEALALWHAHANDDIGSAHLFNAVKPAMLEAFERGDLSDHALEGLIGKLLSVAQSHRQGEARDYELSSPEIRRALTVGPPAVREHAAWRLWRMMGAAGGLPADKAERWRTVVGPLFDDVWPLDVRLRSEDTSRKLVFMALECQDEIPNAVDAIVPLLVPYQLYGLARSLSLERKHSTLVAEHPAACVRLANALIDPAVCPVPNDLAIFLEESMRADPSVANEPSYIRLFALRRQMSA